MSKTKILFFDKTGQMEKLPARPIKNKERDNTNLQHQEWKYILELY